MDPQQALSVNPAGSIPMGAYLRAIASPPGASENVNPSEIPPQLYSTGQEQQIAGGCSQTTVQQQQQPYFQSQQQQSATTNVDALLPQQPSPSSSQQGNAFFVASCPPYSKPLLDANTGLGQPCSGMHRNFGEI